MLIFLLSANLLALDVQLEYRVFLLPANLLVRLWQPIQPVYQIHKVSAHLIGNESIGNMIIHL